MPSAESHCSVCWLVLDSDGLPCAQARLFVWRCRCTGEYRSEYWPRAYDGSGAFDFAADASLSPHKGLLFSTRVPASAPAAPARVRLPVVRRAPLSFLSTAAAPACCFSDSLESTAGDAIEDVLASQGKATHLNAQERWADGVIARRDAQ